MPRRESEYEGRRQRNRVSPPPHEPTPSEQLMLTYTTGDPEGAFQPDDGSAFVGDVDERQRRERGR